MTASDTAALVPYSVTEAQIAETKARYANLACDTPRGYEEVRLAIAHVRDTRTAIEKRRVELKADALAYGRLVDSEAKRLTSLLVEIEEPLKAKKAAVDEEKARIRAEKEAAERAAIEAELAKKREAEEEAARVIREAEEKRLAEERAALEAERVKLAEAQAALEAARKAEEDRVAAARAAEEAERAAARKIEADRIESEREAEYRRQIAEREKLAAERAAIAAERAAAERAEAERLAAARAIEEAEAAKLAKAKREAELAALAPDVEKVRAYARALRNVPVPELTHAGMDEAVRGAAEAVAAIADDLEAIYA